MSETVTHVTPGSIFEAAALDFPPEHRIKAELVDEIGRLGYGVDIVLRPPATGKNLRTVHVSP